MQKRSRPEREGKKQEGFRLKLISAAVILAIIFLFANQGFRKMRNNRRECKRLEAEIERLAREQVHLKKELSLARDDLGYLERVARKELGLIQPGEVEYRFIEEK